jgi:hypothetical protein
MVLKSVGVLSAGKIMGVLGALGGLIGGAMIALMSVLGGAAQMHAANPAGGPHFPAAFLGIGAIILMPIIYGIFGFIAGLLYALFYNIAAGIIGGLELELEPRVP